VPTEASETSGAQKISDNFGWSWRRIFSALAGGGKYQLASKQNWPRSGSTQRLTGFFAESNWQSQV